MNSNLFLYKGVMKVDGKTFTVCSMISEKHDTLSICNGLAAYRYQEPRVMSKVTLVCTQTVC